MAATELWVRRLSGARGRRNNIFGVERENRGLLRKMETTNSLILNLSCAALLYISRKGSGRCIQYNSDKTASWGKVGRSYINLKHVQILAVQRGGSMTSQSVTHIVATSVNNTSSRISEFTCWRRFYYVIVVFLIFFNYFNLKNWEVVSFLCFGNELVMLILYLVRIIINAAFWPDV